MRQLLGSTRANVACFSGPATRKAPPSHGACVASASTAATWGRSSSGVQVPPPPPHQHHLRCMRPAQRGCSGAVAAAGVVAAAAPTSTALSSSIISLGSRDAELADWGAAPTLTSRSSSGGGEALHLALALTSTMGTAAVRGYLKQEMQDCFSVVADLRPAPTKGSSQPLGAASAPVLAPVTFAAIFDGHAGLDAAQHAAHRMHTMLSQDNRLWAALEAPAQDEAAALAVAACWQRLFAELDSEILAASRGSGHLNGCTALAAICCDGGLVVANAGDSRAVLCRDGVAVRMSTDHCPDVPLERQRIEANGGVVRVLHGISRVALPCHATQRIKLLAVSRALGDREFKEACLLVACPDVSTTPLRAGADAFAVLASDGLWGWCSDQEAVDCVRELLAKRAATAVDSTQQQLADGAAEALVHLALSRGSHDDITVIVQLFR